MIDELSLGLAPAVDRAPPQRLRELRDAGTDDRGRRAVGRPRARARRPRLLPRAGQVRFAGPPAELLERPDLVRAVFLGAAAASASPPRRRRPLATRAGARRGSSSPAIAKHFGGVVALDDVSFDVAPARSSASSAPNGAGKTTLFDVVSGFVRPDAGTIALRARRRDRSTSTRARRAHRARGSASAARSRTAGSSRAHRARDDRGRVRARRCASATRSPPRCTCPRSRAPRPRCARRVDELVELLGLGAVRRPVRATSSRPAPAASSTSRACSRTSRRCCSSTSRRAGSRSARPRRSAPLLRDVRDTLGAGLLVIEHDLGVLATVADRLVALDLGRVVAVGHPDTVLADPAVARVVPRRLTA